MKSFIRTYICDIRTKEGNYTEGMNGLLAELNKLAEAINGKGGKIIHTSQSMGDNTMMLLVVYESNYEVRIGVDY